MYILYEANGQDIIYSCATCEEMARYLHISQEAVRSRVAKHRQKLKETPEYRQKVPFVVRDDTDEYIMNQNELIRLARLGLRPGEIAEYLGVSTSHITSLMSEMADVIGPVQGAYKEKLHNTGLRPDFAWEWERITRKLRNSGADLSRIVLTRE